MSTAGSEDVLALSLRPTKFSQLVGQSRVVGQIRSQYESGRMPRAWLFHGPTGNGKTTAARILALSLQERKPEVFGEPASETVENADTFCITEINASQVTGIEELTKVAHLALYAPPPGSRRRVFILDEAQRISKPAQNALLKPFEDGPRSSVWIICTTDPSQLLLTLRRRCIQCYFQPLGTEGIKRLTIRAKKKIGYEGPINKFVERMDQLGISSPGLILNAFEAYVANATLPNTDDVELIDPISICRCFLTGSWENTAGMLRKLNAEQARDLQMVLMGYLKTILLGSGGKTAKAVGSVIIDLAAAPMLDGQPLMAYIAAVLNAHIGLIPR